MPARSASIAYAAAVAGVLALGLWLFWPTLELGLFADDYPAAAMASGTFAAPRAPLDLFNFADGTRQDVRAIQHLGSLAWWTPDDFRASFMRPLSSALVHLDRALFGDALWAHHAHSIFAWALLAVAASLLYRRLLPAGVAALATAFFALDQSQQGPVLWLCNRGGLYAVLFGVLGLGAHLRWRSEGRRAHAFLSALFFSIGLLFGEWVIPMYAYLLAFELVGTRDPWRRRLLCLLPTAVPALAFLTVRAVLGYGARGSGVYVDPTSDPGGFAQLLLHRVPVFAADMVLDLSSSRWDAGSPWRDRILAWNLLAPELWRQLPSWRFFHVAIGVLAIALALAALRYCWPGLTAQERVRVRWLLLGALLALIPVAGAFASTRLTLAASFGSVTLFALVVRQVLRALRSAPRIGLPRWLAHYALGGAVIYVQLIAPLREDLQDIVDRLTATVEWVLAAPLDPHKVADQRVFLMTSQEFTSTFYFAYTWAYHHRPMPRSFVPISAAPYAHDVERTADNVLELRTLGGGFFGSPFELHFRAAERPMRLGEAVQLNGVRIQVVRVLRGAPETLQLTFEHPLEDGSYVFLTATSRGIERLPIPAVGQSVRLPRAGGPSWAELERGRYERRIGPFPDFLEFEPLPEFAAYDPERGPGSGRAR